MARDVSTDRSPITRKTKVAALLDEYPELEDTLIEIAPPFKKLRNPILRRSVAKVASLRQAAAVGRIPVNELVNVLRAAVGQPPLERDEGAADVDYFPSQPEWFLADRVTVCLDESVDFGESEMAITAVLKQGNQLPAGDILELRTTFLPVPGIDIMRAKGFETWSVEDAPDQIRTYFTKPAK